MRTSLIALTVLFASSIAVAQDNRSAQQLFEAGELETALQAIRSQPEAVKADGYLAAQILVKLERRDEAKDVLAPLAQQQDDRVWSLIAESARALIDAEVDRALGAAKEAVSTDPASFFAHYQLGQVEAARNNWAGAAEAFERASQADPLFAYAHYYAALAYSRVQRADQTATHLQAFLTLAPAAPERPAVESIMRTLRGR